MRLKPSTLSETSQPQHESGRKLLTTESTPTWRTLLKKGLLLKRTFESLLCIPHLQSNHVGGRSLFAVHTAASLH